jgi:hypothetical protein
MLVTGTEMRACCASATLWLDEMETQLVWGEASEEGLRRTLREHRHRGLTRRYLVTGRDNEVLNPKKKGMR